MTYTIDPNNSNWTLSDSDMTFLNESENRERDYEFHKQRMNELQNIFDLTDIERAFQENQYEQFHLFREKNKFYGKENITNGLDTNDKLNVKTIHERLIVRMEDKMNRFKQMVRVGSDGTPDESVFDTLNDIANYANIASLVKQGKWK